MANKIIIPYPADRVNFKAASTVLPGSLVTLSTSGIAKAGAVDDEYIGVVLPDEAHFADSEARSYLVGTNVPVKMRTAPINVIAANVIAVGNFVKLAAAGQVGVEATAGTKTLNTIGIALTAGGTSEDITIVPL